MPRFSCCLLALVLGTGSTAVAQSAAARLRSLFDARWRYTMTEHPEFATVVGYPGQNGRWTDNSLEAIARRARELQRPLRELHAIDRARLSRKEQLSYDLFEKNLKEQIEANQFHDEYFAITQLDGPQQDPAD